MDLPTYTSLTLSPRAEWCVWFLTFRGSGNSLGKKWINFSRIYPGIIDGDSKEEHKKITANVKKEMQGEAGARTAQLSFPSIKGKAVPIEQTLGDLWSGKRRSMIRDPNCTNKWCGHRMVGRYKT